MKLFFALLILSLFNFQIFAQEVKESYLKGVGLQLRAQGSYFTEGFIRILPAWEFQAIGGYAYHEPELSNLNKIVVNGFYWGGGLSFLTAPLRKSYNPDKKVKGSFKVGFKMVGGRMWIDASKVFQGSAYQSYKIEFHLRNQSFAYNEFNLGYEINFENRFKIDFYPFIKRSNIMLDINGFKPNFAPVSGHNERFAWSSGVALYYLWK